MLEPVRWSRGGLRWKVILVLFLYIYNTYAFLRSPFTLWLTLICSAMRSSRTERKYRKKKRKDMKLLQHCN
jgi:hypothetical protein